MVVVYTSNQERFIQVGIMWIAKNSITGRTYGKKYSSIYDCQQYIDSELSILQYEYMRICAIEEGLDDERDFQQWLNQHEEYNSSSVNSVVLMIQARIAYAVSKFPFLTAHRNNVIRCYNVQQKRFADGFDF